MDIDLELYNRKGKERHDIIKEIIANIDKDIPLHVNATIWTNVFLSLCYEVILAIPSSVETLEENVKMFQDVVSTHAPKFLEEAKRIIVQRNKKESDEKN